MEPKLKLVYFDIRGRAEMLRLVLAAAGKEYEEERIQFADWPAKKSSFYGQTNEDKVRIGEVRGLWEDQMQSAILEHRWGKTEEEKAVTLKKAIEEDLPRFFGYYEGFLKENGGTGYVVGNSLSLADFCLYDMGDNLLQMKKDALEGYPLLQKLRQNVEANPKVKAYLDSRKKTSSEHTIPEK